MAPEIPGCIHQMADPLLLLRNVLQTADDPTSAVLLYDANGSLVQDISSCHFLQLQPECIFARNQSTNYRSKRGTSDCYALDAVWFLVCHHSDSSYGDYMQDARRNGVGVISLVDRKDLTAYVLEEDAVSQFIDTEAPLPTPITSFDQSTVEKKTSMDTYEEIVPSLDKTKTSQHHRAVFHAPLALADAINGDFSSALQIGRRELEQQQHLEGQASTSTRPSGSLLDQIASANRPTSVDDAPSRSVSKSSTAESITPIIIVPATSSSTINMYNAESFLGASARFESVQEAKERGVRKDSNVLFVTHTFSPSSSSSSKSKPKSVTFQIMDNASRLTLLDWDRVVAVFIQGAAWQFKGWKWETPVDLFRHVLGFHLLFDDAKSSNSSSADSTNWNVHPLLISHSKRHLDATAHHHFWNLLELHLKSKKLL